MSTKTEITITATALTDNSGGTASGTIAEILAATYDGAVVSNAVADMAAQIAAITIDLTAIKTSLDSSHSRITT